MDNIEFVKVLEKRAADAEIEVLRLRQNYNRLIDDLQYATYEVERLGGRLPHGWQVPEKLK